LSLPDQPLWSGHQFHCPPEVRLAVSDSGSGDDGYQSRFAVQIPHVNTNVTISDAFIFLVMLLYGGLAGMLLAAVEGLFSGLRISKRPLVVAFNSAMMLFSTSLTVLVLQLTFGPVGQLRFLDRSHFIAAVGAMALAQYFSNSGICAVGLAIKEAKSVWRTWQTHYLWTSITYLSGAALAAIASNSIDRIGLLDRFSRSAYHRDRLFHL
jgi:uncharacterized membrane protein